MTLFGNRRLVIALAAGLVLFAAGCAASSNKGKIEGRWKFVSASTPADAAKLRDKYLEFGDDGSVFLRAFAEQSTENTKPPGWRYKLLANNDVDFYALPGDDANRLSFFPQSRDVVRVTIRIETAPGEKYERREMTLTGPDGSELKLSWFR